MPGSHSVKTTDHRGHSVPLWNPGLTGIGDPNDPADRFVRQSARRAQWASLDPVQKRSVGFHLILAGFGLIGVATSFSVASMSSERGLFTLVQAACAIATIYVVWQAIRAANAAKLTNSLVRRGACASCGYRLSGLAPAPDGCTVCPECGSAWRCAS